MSDLVVTAVHEAAHAVIARHFGLDVGTVDVIKCAGRSGRCEVFKPITDLQWKRWGVQLLAGREAERIICKVDDPNGSVSDLARFHQHMPDEDVTLYRMAARSAVKRHRAVIVKVARVLACHGTLTAAQVAALLPAGHPRAANDSLPGQESA